jgi:hypothetical protein
MKAAEKNEVSSTKATTKHIVFMPELTAGPNSFQTVSRESNNV